MQKRLLRCLFLLLISCSPLHNHLDEKILQCGPETADLDRDHLLRPDREDWQGIIQTVDGYRALPRTSRGCAILPSTGAAFLRDRTRPEGLALRGFALKNEGAIQQPLLTGVESLVPHTYVLACGARESQGLTLPYLRQMQPASLLHLYELQYSLRQGDQVLSQGRQLIDGGSRPIDLPRVLAEGSYQLRLSLLDVFDATLRNTPAKEMECPLLIDRTAPAVNGFVETLGKVGELDIHEVAPGQALNLSISDAGAATIYYCLTTDDQPCENFQALVGSIYMPEQGIVHITYYTRDAAGNESPKQTLPPLAVMHRESMQAIDRGLSLARLEAARGSQMEADRLLLDAYQAFYRLTLPMERDPLRRKLAATYSEIGRAQFLRSSWSDHRSSVTRLVVDERGVTTLDSDGLMVQRSEQGVLLQNREQVVDQQGDLLLFRDGRFERDGRSGRLTLGNIRRMQRGDGRLLVSHGANVSLLRDNGSDWTVLWTVAQDAVDALAFGKNGAILIAGGSSLRVLQGSDGKEMQRFSWHPYCRFTQWYATSQGYFIGLKTSIPTGVNPTEPFHCELLQWDENSEPVPVDATKIMTANFGFDPTLYRFEEVVVMAFDPWRQWLYISRNLDGRIVIYDLKQNRAEIYDASFPGEPTAINLSADGKNLGIAWSGDTLLMTWGVDEGADALQFPIMEPRFQVKALPIRVTQIGFNDDARSVWTMDENRELRSYIQNDALIPILRDELRETWRGQTAFDAILRLVGRDVVMSDAYGLTRKTYPLPADSQVIRLILTADGIFMLDTAARIYQHALDGEAWTLRYQGQAPVRDLVLSPTGSHALILAAGRTGILGRTGGNFTGVTIQGEGTLAAWNVDETLFALATSRDQSLWTTKGHVLVEHMPAKTAVPPGSPYQPFSADGRSWLVRQDQTVKVFNAVQETWDAPLILNATPGLVRFVEGRNDRLLLAENTNPGLSQLVVERDLQGNITREWGSLAKTNLRQFLGSDLGITNNGRVLRWSSETRAGETLIAEFEPVYGLLQEYQAHASVLVVDVLSQAVSFLYLDADERQMQRLCDWLRPSLTAARDARSRELLRQCLARVNL